MTDDLIERYDGTTAEDMEMVLFRPRPNGEYVKFADHAQALKAKDDEIARLRQIVRLYGNRTSMSRAPAELQISIDEAMAERTALGDSSD